MPVPRNFLSALAAAAAIGKANAAFGSAFSTGPTSDSTYIVESWATLNLPAAPTDNAGDLSLWVGMGTSTGDLIQSIADNSASDDWSLFAYTLMSTSGKPPTNSHEITCATLLLTSTTATTQSVVQAEGSTATGGTAVTFHYYYEASSGNYTQDVIVDGAIISTLSTSDGEAQGWGSAVECAAEDCGTVDAHTWTNVSIILSGADTAYVDTLALGEGVDASMTSEDGITWEVGTINIPGYDFSTLAVTDSVASTSTTTSSKSAAASGVPTYGSGASASGVPSMGSGSSSFGSSSTGSESAQPSGSFGGFGGSSFGGGSSTAGSESAQPSGSFGSYGGGSSTTGSQGAQPSGGFGGQSGGFGGQSGGSATWGSAGAQSSSTGFGGFGGFGGSSSQSGSSPMASAGASSGGFGGWSRSRIARGWGHN